jgi:hypothetical protein
MMQVALRWQQSMQPVHQTLLLLLLLLLLLTHPVDHP